MNKLIQLLRESEQHLNETVELLEKQVGLYKQLVDRKDQRIEALESLSEGLKAAVIRTANDPSEGNIKLLQDIAKHYL